MNSFERFRHRNSLRMVAENNASSSFVFNSYPSTVITDTEGNKLNAAVVNKQEQDLAYVYTQLKDKIKIGSCWSVKGLNFLIAEEIVTIKDVYWNKYKALRCNVDIGGFKGFFYGPKKSHIDTVLKENFLVFSSQEPVLVLPSEVGLVVGDRIVINNRGWKITEVDNISTFGVSYFSLVAATVSKEVVENGATVEGKDDITIMNKEPEVLDNKVIYTYANEELVIESNGGYIAFETGKIEVVKRTHSNVVLKLPFGVSSTKVKIKVGGTIREVEIRERR